MTRRVAAYGLETASLSWPVEPLPDPAWERLSRQVVRQRLAGLLAAAVADGSLPVTEEQRAEVGTRHRDAMTGSLQLEARLLEVAEALDGSDIPWRVLKGSATAHLDYADPALRVFGDIDVLVPGSRILEAVEALGEIGARRRHPPLAHGFDQRFAKSVELADERGWEVDLHRTLALEPFGLRIDEADLFAGSEEFEIGGRKLPALPVAQRFLLACYHAALGNFPARLVPLRDLAGIAASGRLDVGEVVGLADRWWGRAVVADAVTTTWTVFGLPAGDRLSRWAASYRPSRAEQIALAAFQRRDRRQAHRTMVSLRTLPGVGRRISYLRAIVRPGKAYLDSRGLGAGQWVARGKAALPKRSTP